MLEERKWLPRGSSGDWVKSGVIMRKEIKKQPYETVVDLMRHVTFWVSCGGGVFWEESRPLRTHIWALERRD